MKFSIELHTLFQAYEHALVEEFLQNFDIRYYIMVTKKDGSIHAVIPVKYHHGIWNENEDGYYFANIEKEYLCAIYDQDEAQIVTNFNRFLKVKAFL